MATDQGCENSLLHRRKEERWKEGGWEGERERARNECHVKLKSLVAFPLHWLPRDQWGAESTQGRKKWRVFREEERGEIQTDGETKKKRREGEWRGRKRWMYI